MSAQAEMFAPAPVVKRDSVRWYVRCRGCLSVSAVELPRGVDAHNAVALQGARCGACDGKIAILGRVKATGFAPLLVTDVETRAACDARCTYAPGPNCECRCGGQNHGTGATVQIEHVDTVPRLTPRDLPKAQRIASEWRAELARVEATRPARLLARSRAGDYLARDDYDLARRLATLVHGARTMKTHKGRMAMLARITDEGIQ